MFSCIFKSDCTFNVLIIYKYKNNILLKSFKNVFTLSLRQVFLCITHYNLFCLHMFDINQLLPNHITVIKTGVKNNSYNYFRCQNKRFC